MKAPRKMKKKAKRGLELAHKCKITIRLVDVENGIRHWEYKEKTNHKNK
jgi:hypothetical protein